MKTFLGWLNEAVLNNEIKQECENVLNIILDLVKVSNSINAGLNSDDNYFLLYTNVINTITRLYSRGNVSNSVNFSMLYDYINDNINMADELEDYINNWFQGSDGLTKKLLDLTKKLRFLIEKLRLKLEDLRVKHPDMFQED